MNPWVGALVLALAVGTAALGPVALRWLDRHPVQPDPDDPPPVYASLDGWPFRLLVGLATAVTTTAVVLLLPPAHWPIWLVLSTFGVLLVVIDGFTTWLPLRLCQLLWSLGAVAVLVGWALGAGPLGPVLGAVAFGAFWWLVWRITAGIGFGDVRLAPVLGAAAGVSGSMLFWALLLGTVLGALHGVLRLVRGRRGPYAYGPSLLLGCFLALLMG